MSSGVSTNNVPLAASLVDLLGNEDVGGGLRRTARLPFADLTKLIAVPTSQVTTRLRSELFAMLNYPASTGAFVVADPVLANRGIYIKNGATGTGSWTRVGDLPVYDFGEELQIVEGLDGLAVADAAGFVAMLLDGDGLHLADASFGRIDGIAYAVADAAGFVGFALTTGGRLLAGGLDAGGGSTAAYSGSELSERNARALGISAAIRDGSNLQASTFGFVIANYNGGGAAAGSNMLISSGLRKMEAYGARDVDGTPRVVEKEVDTGINAWCFYAVRIGNAFHRIDDKTNGRSGIGPVAFSRSAPNGIPYLIGSGNGGVQGLVDIAFAGIHSVELTDAEIEANYQRIKAYLATKSITV